MELIWILANCVTVLNFSFEPERDSFQEPFFNEDNENETEQERISDVSVGNVKLY